MVTSRVAFSLLFALGGACTGEDSSPNTAPGGPGQTRRSSARHSPRPTNDTLDLTAMLVPVPEYAGQGRNLFTYGPVRSEAPPPPAPPVERPPPPAPAPQPQVSRPAPAARVTINVQYAGFLEKTTADGARARYAIFLDGNEILAGTEGETVGNRFRVVEIGLESVTVSAQGSDVTQRIPLATRSN